MKILPPTWRSRFLPQHPVSLPFVRNLNTASQYLAASVNVSGRLKLSESWSYSLLGCRLFSHVLYCYYLHYTHLFALELGISTTLTLPLWSTFLNTNVPQFFDRVSSAIVCVCIISVAKYSGNAYYRSVQSILLSRMLSRNVKVKIYKTMSTSCFLWVRNLVSHAKGRA
jgi:hypothetical protein